MGETEIPMTLEQMVRNLWDREQIRELTYAYGLAIEAQDAARMASLFTADGAVDFTSLGRGVMRGHAEIMAFYRSLWALDVKPFFTNHVIEVDGDRASGICSFENRARRGTQSIIGAGRLHDTYMRVEERWKFASRRVEVFYFVPLAQGWAEASGPGSL